METIQSLKQDPPTIAIKKSAIADSLLFSLDSYTPPEPQNNYPERALHSNFDFLNEISVPLKLVFSNFDLPLNQMLELKNGSTVPLTIESLSTVSLELDGEVIATGELVISDSQLIIKISSVATETKI